KDTDNKIILAVSLFNRSGAGQITGLDLSIGHPERKIESVKVINSGQSYSFLIPINSTEADSILIAKYTFLGSTDSSVYAIHYDKHDSMNSAIASLIPALLSLAGVLIGALLVHLFSKRRDLARSRFEWGKMLFDKYEGKYRAFLYNWGGTPSAELLESEF